MNREKAVAGQRYIVDGVEYVAKSSLLGCKDCATEFNLNNRCSDFPICSDADLSVIFVRVEK